MTRTKTETLIAAMRILARDIHSGDCVANAAIVEAADRLEELKAECDALLVALTRIDDTAKGHPYAGVTCGELARASYLKSNGRGDNT